MKKNILTFGLLLSSITHTQVNTVQAEAQPNRQLSILEQCRKDFFDFIGLERAGYYALSQEKEQFIRTIITELDMDDYCIEIRGMTYQAQCEVGYINAFVIPSILSKKQHAYLYISENWFDTLSHEEKRALIGHELMHIKGNHATKTFFVGITVLASTLFLKTIIYKKLDTEKFILTHTSFSLLHVPSSLLITQKYSRMCEKEADINAAQAMNNKSGMLTLLHTIKTKTKKPKSKFMVKRIKDKILKPIKHLFSSHPTDKQRIEYIENL